VRSNLFFSASCQVLLLLVFTPGATAATINVPGDSATIQAAIADAGTVKDDEIVVAAGTYVENIDFLRKAITLRSASGDPADTIIDGGGSDSVVTCDSGEDSNTVLDGFTITNGASATYGGGMYNYESSPTVTNCILWGDSPDEIINAGSNIDATPFFVDVDGPDNTAGTEDDNLLLQSGSPCIDAGDNTVVLAGITTDLDGSPRFIDGPPLDTGIGVPPLVDMGAYEYGSALTRCTPQLDGDINCDGIVSLLDQALLALHWLDDDMIIK